MLDQFGVKLPDNSQGLDFFLFGKRSSYRYSSKKPLIWIHDNSAVKKNNKYTVPPVNNKYNVPALGNI